MTHAIVAAVTWMALAVVYPRGIVTTLGMRATMVFAQGARDIPVFTSRMRHTVAYSVVES